MQSVSPAKTGDPRPPWAAAEKPKPYVRIKVKLFAETVILDTTTARSQRKKEGKMENDLTCSLVALKVDDGHSLEAAGARAAIWVDQSQVSV